VTGAGNSMAKANSGQRSPEETSRLLASIVESSDDAIITKDLNGIITSWNKGAERIFGYSAEEAIGKPISMIAAPGRADEMSGILERIKKGERVDHYETVRRAKNGALVNISLTVSPLRGEDGHFTGASKIARDITQQVRAAEKLAELHEALKKSEAETRRARDWFLTTLSSIGDAVIATDADGRVTFLNTVGQALTGWAQDDAAGHRLDEVFVIQNEETGAIVENPVTKVMREEVVVGLANHTKLIAKDGREVPIDDSAAPIRDADGKIAGIVLVFRDVTERKEAEKELRRAVAFDEAVLANMGEGLYTVDADGLVTSMNPAAEELFGWSFEELRGKKMHAMTHHHHPDRTAFPAEDCACLQVLKEGQSLIDHEDVFIRKDGTFFDVIYSSSPLREGGDIRGLIVVFRDVSARREMENALRENQQALSVALAATQRLQEISSELIREGDVAALYEQILDAAVAIMRSECASIQMLESKGEDGEVLHLLKYRGFPPWAAKLWERLRHEAGTSCALALETGKRVMVQDVEQSESTIGRENVEIYRKAGILAMQSTPLLSRNGEPLGMISTHWREPHQPSERDLRLFDVLARQAADVIERSQAEIALRASEARLADQKEALELAVSGAPIDVTLDVLVRAGRRQIGKDARTAIFLADADRLRFATADGMSPQFSQDSDGIFPIGPQEASCGAAAYTGEPVIVRDVKANALWAPFLQLAEKHGIGACWSFPIRSQGGEMLGTLAVYHGAPSEPDGRALEGAGLLTKTAGLILERHQQAEIRRQAEEALRRANADLNQFAFAASHDLQEPLRMIASYAELLLKGYPSTVGDEASLCVKFITEGTKRMRELLADLLAYTQVNADEQPKEIESVDLNAVFQEAVENLKIAIAQSGAVITSAKLPIIAGQKVHFLQLFQNLISNAIKYSGGRTPRVQVTAVKKDAGWQIAVADNGIGIAPDYHKNIFGVFKRLHGKTIPGTGIGLAICQRVVERYGGRIWVESQLNEGSTFYFTLPAAKGANA